MGGNPESRIRALGIWQGAPTIEPIAGGITNRNYLVRDGERRCVVRLGEDIPIHQISRSNELAASIAAHAAGLSPAVLHHAHGALVLDYIDGRPLAPDDVRTQQILERILPLIQTCHREMPKHFRGPAMIFWVFHVIRDYAASLKDGCSAHMPRIGGLLDKAVVLERASGPFEITFGHNDLLAANLIDDGRRLWLIDWDYAGFNTPLFDLGGLASNSELPSWQEDWLLEAYFDSAVTDGLRRRYLAMKCASLLRETMWSMVSEIHSTIDFDYGAYTVENLARFNRSFETFAQS